MDPIVRRVDALALRHDEAVRAMDGCVDSRRGSTVRLELAGHARPRDKESLLSSLGRQMPAGGRPPPPCALQDPFKIVPSHCDV